MDWRAALHLPRTRRGRFLFVFLILLVCYGYFLPSLNNWGSNSRMDLVYALGDKGVVKIDDYHLNTEDKAYYNGHYYTEKSIGPSLAGVPFYLVFKGLVQLPPLAWFAHADEAPGSLPTVEEAYDRYDLPESGASGAGHPPIYHAMALTFVTFFSVAVMSALLGGVVYLMASRLSAQPNHALGLALAFGVGTPAFAYSNELYQHQPAAFGAFVGLYLLWLVLEEHAPKRYLWLVGALWGYAAATEYVFVPILACLSLWAAIRMRPRRHLLRVVVGGLPWVLATAAYNLVAFGTPAPVGYRYSAFSGAHQGRLFGIIAPSWDSAYTITFSPYRGLFFLSPFLLLAPIGFYLMARRSNRTRELAAVLLLVCLAFIVYNASYWAGTGADSVGPRFLVPMLPFLSVPIVFALHAATTAWQRAGLGVLVTLSIASVWIQSLAGQGFPPEGVRQPILDHALPLLRQGELRFNLGSVLGLRGFSTLIPLVLLLACIPWLARLAERRSREQALPG